MVRFTLLPTHVHARMHRFLGLTLVESFQLAMCFLTTQRDKIKCSWSGFVFTLKAKHCLWFVSPGRRRFFSTESDSHAGRGRLWTRSLSGDDVDPHPYPPPVAVGCQLHQSGSKRNGYRKEKERPAKSRLISVEHKK